MSSFEYQGFKLRTPCSFIADLDGQILEKNEAFEELFKDVRNFTELLIYPEEWQRITAYLRAGGIIQGWRLRLQNEKGPEWGELFASYDEPNKIVGLLFDVSTRVKTEEALKEALVWRRVLLDAIPQAVIVADFETGTLLEVNVAAQRRFAFPSPRLEKFKVSDLFTNARDWELLKKELIARNRVVFNARQQDFTGHTFPVEIHARRFAYQDEDKIILVIDDSSKKKETEKLLFLLFSALEHANESVIITDREGKIIYVNPAFERTSGYSLEEVLGKTPSILKSGYHSAEFYQNLWSTILSGHTWRGRIVNRRKDGRLYTDEVTIFPARDESLEISHFVAIQRDITRELEIESHLQQVAKLEAIAQLAGGIAHEFNNILTTISGYAELLLIKNKPDKRTRAALETILSQSKRAAHLVSQLLDFSRRSKPEKTTFELGAFIEDNRRLFEDILTEQIELEIIIPEKKFLVHASPSQLKQVFFNLIINARDAMPSGGKITFLLEESILPPEHQSPFSETKRWVKIVISDTGHGISQEISARIFEPFFTTKVNGTGLGLAQVYGIVREHGGYIQVRSIPGQGTTFEIFLPLAEVEESQQKSLFEDF